jgi:hypothetical protein
MFKHVNIVFNKVKDSYVLRLAAKEEIEQNKLATRPTWQGGLQKDQRPKVVRGFDKCVLYPPDYASNTIVIQGNKTCMIINFKTLQGRMFIKGMKGYTGEYINSMIIAMYGMDYDFNNCPEIIQEILKQLPSKDTLLDTNTGVHVQY